LKRYTHHKVKSHENVKMTLFGRRYDVKIVKLSFCAGLAFFFLLNAI